MAETLLLGPEVAMMVAESTDVDRAGLLVGTRSLVAPTSISGQNVDPRAAVEVGAMSTVDNRISASDCTTTP